LSSGLLCDIIYVIVEVVFMSNCDMHITDFGIHIPAKYIVINLSPEIELYPGDRSKIYWEDVHQKNKPAAATEI